MGTGKAKPAAAGPSNSLPVIVSDTSCMFVVDQVLYEDFAFHRHMYICLSRLTFDQFLLLFVFRTVSVIAMSPPISTGMARRQHLSLLVVWQLARRMR